MALRCWTDCTYRVRNTHSGGELGTEVSHRTKLVLPGCDSNTRRELAQEMAYLNMTSSENLKNLFRAYLIADWC